MRALVTGVCVRVCAGCCVCELRVLSIVEFVYWSLLGSILVRLSSYLICSAEQSLGDLMLCESFQHFFSSLNSIGLVWITKYGSKLEMLKYT